MSCQQLGRQAKCDVESCRAALVKFYEASIFKYKIPKSMIFLFIDIFQPLRGGKREEIEGQRGDVNLSIAL